MLCRPCMMPNSWCVRQNAWRFPFQTRARSHARSQRSMISETNIMIGFDTLSGLDTRGKERAYRLAQRGSKDLVKHELFPAERRKNGCPSLPRPRWPWMLTKFLTGHKWAGLCTFVTPFAPFSLLRSLSCHFAFVSLRLAPPSVCTHGSVLGPCQVISNNKLRRSSQHVF